MIAVPTWARFMKRYHEVENLPNNDFSKPAGVIKLEICKDSGLLANPICPNRVMELFNSKYQPTENCDVHKKGSSSERRVTF